MTSESLPPRPTLLRPRDQAGIAAGIAMALVLLLGIWLTGSGTFRKQVEVDSVEKQSARFFVDINTTSWPEIAQLPGIGETVARRVVELREREGRFRSLVELQRVRGVGKTTFERIEPYLKRP
jgi:competence protein ComEA